MCTLASCKVHVIVVGIYVTGVFSMDFSKNNQISNFMKIRPVDAEMFHAGGRTETDRHMTTLILTLSHFREGA